MFAKHMVKKKTNYYYPTHFVKLYKIVTQKNYTKCIFYTYNFISLNYVIRLF